MSIWASLETIGWDDEGWFDINGNPVEPECRGGEVRSYANGWSNHYPVTDGSVEQPAAINLAVIPAWCAGGLDDDFDSVGNWIRLDVRTFEHDYHDPKNIDAIKESYASVVMNEQAVGALVEQLTNWLKIPKITKEIKT